MSRLLNDKFDIPFVGEFCLLRVADENNFLCPVIAYFGTDRIFYALEGGRQIPIYHSWIKLPHEKYNAPIPIPEIETQKIKDNKLLQYYEKYKNVSMQADQLFDLSLGDIIKLTKLIKE